MAAKVVCPVSGKPIAARAHKRSVDQIDQCTRIFPLQSRRIPRPYPQCPYQLRDEPGFAGIRRGGSAVIAIGTLNHLRVEAGLKSAIQTQPDAT